MFVAIGNTLVNMDCVKCVVSEDNVLTVRFNDRTCMDFSCGNAYGALQLLAQGVGASVEVEAVGDVLQWEVLENESNG